MNGNLSESTRKTAANGIGGAVGGYCWGLVQGLSNGLGFVEAMGIGGITILVGFATALLGTFAWKLIKPNTIPRKMLAFGVLGSLFFGLQSLIVPVETLATIDGMTESTYAFGIGGIAGAFGGLMSHVAFIVWEELKHERIFRPREADH